MKTIDQVIIGDWILFEYGYDTQEWCVLAITEDRLQLGNPRWLRSSAMWIEKSQLTLRNAEFLRSGRINFNPLAHIPAIKDFFLPFR